MASLTLQEAPSSALLATYLARRADLKRLLAARLGCPQQAEDVLQEMYLKLAQLGGGVVVERNDAFLYRMAMNLALDLIRQRRRTNARDRQWVDSMNQMSGGEAVAPEPPQDRVIEGRQRLARIMNAAANLPAQCKRIFHLHKIEGLSHAQVADMLGISRSAVEKQMTVALQRLHKADHHPSPLCESWSSGGGASAVTSNEQINVLPLGKTP